MDKKAAIDYITHDDWQESRLGLERVEQLLTRLDNPHHRLKFVHVAGTNGKGSICAMLASVLTAAGMKTGMYTSPYINFFNERMQIDGLPISDDDLAQITARVRKEAEQMPDHPTEFELVTAIAFEYFYQHGCELVVLEVGLGGRLDATNVIGIPEVAVITPVSLDHMDVLGDTVEKIAVEKAGIIKHGGRVISSEQQPCVESTLIKTCKERDADITFTDERDLHIIESTLFRQRFDYREYQNIEIQLPGSYQPRNAMAVIETAELLRDRWDIPDNAIYNGLANAKWPARFEVVHRNPWVIVDGGHNPQCTDSLVENLNLYFPGKKINFVIGVMADKDYQTMFKKILPLTKRIYTVTPDNPRALPAEDMAAYFRQEGVKDVTACSSVEQGIEQALNASEANDVICAFGSYYMAGTIRKVFGMN